MIMVEVVATIVASPTLPLACASAYCCQLQRGRRSCASHVATTYYALQLLQQVLLLPLLLLPVIPLFSSDNPILL